MSTSAPIPQRTPEEQRRAEFIAARNVYIIIFISFVSVCTVAVLITSYLEAHKTGFQAIRTTAPTSFIDKTYMHKTP